MAGRDTQHLYVRDRAAYRRLTRESIRLHRQLHRRWDELARAYRGADLTSLERWNETFREAAAARADDASGSGSPGSKEPLS